ncbi:transposase [Myroides profundi]|uniref:transposase n=1 Tax=Myroides profundi TaxID=480520 RepID=UPI0005A313A8|nr:transposase [Myroides profundi]AJH13867.1 hypothetical protein MPR_0667 [Myroides profundi]AJH13899.1 hypothetical protein MPR_0699 [Myroides profundi]AJH14206.1 hypothetical protein MPR_1017 [Myroides profundi]AJH14462.1 hypothetical protein MPR_1280 [Myroides profundi]AJH16032.1 hypothetical protein MPR_2889 [Myroides profundi]
MGREPKNKERYHLKFIEQIVQEIENGASQNSVIREYSLNKSTLNRWVKKYASPEYHATRKNKVYSESLKRQVVHSITEHHMTAQEACIMYGVESISTINNWLLVNYNKNIDICNEIVIPSLMEEKTSNTESLEIKALKKALSEAQFKIVALNTLIDVAEKSLDIDIRKKSGSKQLKK